MAILRTIEKRIRRLILNLLDSSETIRPGETIAAALPDQPRILLIRIDRIGDAIISTPVPELLRERFPDVKIDLLLGKKNRVIAPLFPFTDHIYIMEEGAIGTIRTLRKLRRNRYNAVVNLHLNRSASASLASRLANGNVVVEYGEENPFSGNEVSKLHHVVQMTTRLTEPLLGKALTQANELRHPLRLILPSDSVARATATMNAILADETEKIDKENIREESRKKVLLNISATHISRSWPADHYIKAARMLLREGMIPMICGTPADAPHVSQIAAASGGLAIPPQENYADFAAILPHADVVVTPDTSTVHLAAALGRPTVALYTSQKTARQWHPWGVPYRTIVNQEGMEAIQPDEVVRNVCELIINTDHPEHQPEQSDRTEISKRAV